MIYEQNQTKSYCVWGRHQSATLFFENDTTETGQNIVLGKCVQCNRKKSKIVSDITIATKGLGRFFKI